MRSASLQYANALADVALTQGASAGDAAAKQLGDFDAAYSESNELRNFFASPAVSRTAKHGVIEKIVARIGADKIIRNFLFLIVDHQRTHLLPEIVAVFQQVIRQRRDVAEVEISSAVELTAAQKGELAKSLERITGKRVEAKYSLDAKLLGGAVVRVGDTVYDGSLRQRLDEMRTLLAAE